MFITKERLLKIKLLKLLSGTLKQPFETENELATQVT